MLLIERDHQGILVRGGGFSSLDELNVHAEQLCEVIREFLTAGEVRAADKFCICTGKSVENPGGLLTLAAPKPGKQQERSCDDKRKVADCKAPRFEKSGHAASMEEGAGFAKTFVDSAARDVSVGPQLHLITHHGQRSSHHP